MNFPHPLLILTHQLSVHTPRGRVEETPFIYSQPALSGTFILGDEHKNPRTP